MRLCPPDKIVNESFYPSVQVSFGLVTIYHNGFWGSINQKSIQVPFGQFEADSVCRQLGFTGSADDSIRTASSYSDEYNFSTCWGNSDM